MPSPKQHRDFYKALPNAVPTAQKAVAEAQSLALKAGTQHHAQVALALATKRKLGHRVIRSVESLEQRRSQPNAEIAAPSAHEGHAWWRCTFQASHYLYVFACVAVSDNESAFVYVHVHGPT